METLKTPTSERPKFLSEVTIKVRPEMKVVSLSGKGDPLDTFDNKIGEVFTFLGEKFVQNGHTLGIYHKNRRDVGVENVTWDACVPIDKEVEITGDEFQFQVLPEVKVVSITLTGGYDLIGQALDHLESVTKANGIETSWPLTEIYIEEGETPVTELQYFVKEKGED